MGIRDKIFQTQYSSFNMCINWKLHYLLNFKIYANS